VELEVIMVLWWYKNYGIFGLEFEVFRVEIFWVGI
jgi:hypothetical protein